jgi:hypothetical protein
LLQKNKAVDSQQRLTDAFWAQAEAEVFVECIEYWSKDLLSLDDRVEENSIAGVQANGDKTDNRDSTDLKKEEIPPGNEEAKSVPVVQAI